MRKRPIFFLAGVLAGATSAILGASSPTMLAIGVGPLFFGALVLAITFTASLQRVHGVIWRYVAVAFLSTAAYVLALFSFSIVAGYAPQVLGVRPSSDILEFRGDIWVGLIAGVLTASIFTELVTYILGGKWSNSFLFKFMIAGMTSILLTFIVNARFHNYWSFLGVLLPVGESLLCGLVGMQLNGAPYRASAGAD